MGRRKCPKRCRLGHCCAALRWVWWAPNPPDCLRYACLRIFADLGDNARKEEYETVTFPPQRIVCLTEETVETLYLLREDARIVGVSGYAVRPARVRK